MKKIEDRLYQIRIPQFISVKIKYTSVFISKHLDYLMLFSKFLKKFVHTRNYHQNQL